MKTGQANSNYRHGKYCEPQYCICGALKDHRSKRCAKCAGKSYGKDGQDARSITVQKIIPIVKSSRSFSEVSRKAHVSRAVATAIIQENKLDISHFRAAKGRSRQWQDILVKDSRDSQATIKKCVRDNNLLPYLCAICNSLPLWQGKPLTLQLHHKNGKRMDNRIGNLMYICPNCHSQTETYTGKNYRKAKGGRLGGKS